MPRRRYKRSILCKQPLKEFKLLNFLQLRQPRTLPRFLPRQDPPENQTIPYNYSFVDIRSLAKEVPAETAQKELKEKSLLTNEFAKVEECIIESIEPSNLLARLVIFKRTFDDVYFGKQLSDKVSPCNGPPDFPLGDELHKNRYIEQFKETYTERGNKMVKTTRQIGTNPPEIKYSPAAEVYLEKRKLQLQKLGRLNANGANSQVANSLLMKNKLKLLSTGNVNNNNNSNGTTPHLLISAAGNRQGPASQNGQVAVPRTIDQVPSSAIRLTKMVASPTTQRFTLPTSTRTLNASRIVNVTAIGTATQATAASTSKAETVSVKNEFDSSNAISVTYLPSNIFMSGSTIYTVRPATSSDNSNLTSVSASNQQNQQQQRPPDNSFDASC